MEKMILDMSKPGHGAGVLALGAASVSATLPANTETVVLSSSGNAHFRFTQGASSAVATDPMITSNSQMQTFRLPANVIWTLSIIQDAASTGNLSYFPVYEG